MPLELLVLDAMLHKNVFINYQAIWVEKYAQHCWVTAENLLSQYNMFFVDLEGMLHNKSFLDYYFELVNVKNFARHCWVGLKSSFQR